jgi:hypothetical protein
MANLVLQDDLLRFESIKMDYVVDRDIIRSQSGVLRFNSNTSSRRVIRCTLTALGTPDSNNGFNQGSEEKDYLRGVVQAAYYNNDSIEFTLPPEVQQYTGTHSGNDINLLTAVAAGSNTVTVRLGTSTQGFPSSNALLQGEFITFGNHSTQYVINSYNSITGQLKFHPVLRDSLVPTEVVNYKDLTFRGYITSADLKETFVAGNNNFLKMDLVIEEII